MERETPLWGWSLPAPRPAQPRRMKSNSSDRSHTSDASFSSCSSEDPFAFSPAGTPLNENGPSRARTSAHSTNLDGLRDGPMLGKEVNTRPKVINTISAPENYHRISQGDRRKPIPIELPGRRRTDPTSASVCTPPEPLSARGDIHGGYFPLHEDPQSRVRVPHPFQPLTNMTRHRSPSRSAEPSNFSTEPRLLGAGDPSKPSQSFSSQSNVSKSSHTPLSSYIPNGAQQDVALPLGKYYPSNWENRHGQSRQNRPFSPSKCTSLAVQSETQVPMYHGDQAQARSGSEAQRRLQQYQRDMVAQAAMATRALLAKTASTASSAAASSYPSVPAALLRSHKPVSPRLQPLGSPGPVTPMSLEDGYLTLRGRIPAVGLDHSVHHDAGAGVSSDWSGNGRHRQCGEDSHLAPPLSALSV